jgi:hypothetical protein
MTKEEVIAKVRSLNFPKDSYIVYGSAPFAVLGIREVNDIDLLVSKEIYEELAKKGWKKVYKGPKDEPLTYDIFEAHKTWEFSPYAPTLPELLSRATEIEGISFASLEDVRRWKEASGRPKDFSDLKLIDSYLASLSSNR